MCWLRLPLNLSDVLCPHYHGDPELIHLLSDCWCGGVYVRFDSLYNGTTTVPIYAGCPLSGLLIFPWVVFVLAEGVKCVH